MKTTHDIAIEINEIVGMWIDGDDAERIEELVEQLVEREAKMARTVREVKDAVKGIRTS